MRSEEIKSFKQFMLDLDHDTRSVVYQKIVNKCYVSSVTIRLWTNGKSSPQEWRRKIIKRIAKRYGCVVMFEPIKRRQCLDCLDEQGSNDQPTEQGGEV